MAKCDYCGSTIIFGGKRQGELRFCNDRCRGNGGLLLISRQLPENVVHESVWKVHQGICPKCQGAGPIDVHISHRVWSALFLTSWKSIPQVSCRSCGVKGQLGSTAFSLALGWWGFPWGFIVTPVQIVRNVAGMLGGPDPTKPSPHLERLIRLNIAAQAVAAQSTRKAGAAPAT
jgi:hypothetical protein